MAYELERVKEMQNKKKPRKGVIYAAAPLPLCPSPPNLDLHV